MKKIIALLSLAGSMIAAIGGMDVDTTTLPVEEQMAYVTECANIYDEIIPQIQDAVEEIDKEMMHSSSIEYVEEETVVVEEAEETFFWQLQELDH